MSLIGVYGVSSFFSFLSFKMACFYITASLLTVSLLTSQSYIKSIGTKQTQRICVVVLKLLDLLIPIICFVLKHTYCCHGNQGLRRMKPESLNYNFILKFTSRQLLVYTCVTRGPRCSCSTCITLLLQLGQNTTVLMMSNLNMFESFCLLQLDANVCLLSSH